MTIHWKALEEHFLMVPLIFRLDLWGENALSEFFSKNFSVASFTYGDLEFEKDVTVDYLYSSDVVTYDDAVENSKHYGEGWTLMNQLGHPFVVQKMFKLAV
jgi:hypothetical protein